MKFGECLLLFCSDLSSRIIYGDYKIKISITVSLFYMDVKLGISH